MFLKAWKMPDDTVIIHDPACKHRKPAKTGRNAYAAIVADGKSEYLSKEAFAVDYWKRQDLQVLDPFQSLNFMPCCDELPVQEPKPKGKQPKAAKPPRIIGHRAYAAKQPPEAMVQFAAWIEREFKEELGEIKERDVRLVMIASKCYNWFQSSDMRVRDTNAA